MFAAVIGSSGLPPGFAGTPFGGAEYPKFFLTDRGQHFEDIAHPDGVKDPVPDADMIHSDGDELLGGRSGSCRRPC